MRTAVQKASKEKKKGKKEKKKKKGSSLLTSRLPKGVGGQASVHPDADAAVDPSRPREGVQKRVRHRVVILGGGAGQPQHCTRKRRLKRD